MIVKLLTERHLEFLSLKGGCTGSSESSLVKMSNCWKSHALAHFIYFIFSETSWCYKVMKVLTRTLMVERGCCKEKRRHHTIIIGVFLLKINPYSNVLMF